MTTHSFGDYRSLLEAPPSPSLRDALWRMIGDEGALTPELLAYISSHLSKWPGSIRLSPADAWTARAEGGEDTPALALCQDGHINEENHRWLASPHLTSLRTLRLSGDLTPEAMTWLAQNLEGLEIASIRGSQCPSAQALAKFVQWPGLANVRHIDLSFSSLDDDGLIALVRSRYTRSIETLTLTGCKLGAPSVEALMASRRMGSLRRVDLRYCPVGAEGAVALASGRNAAKLEWLHVGKKDVTSKGITTLKRSTVLPEHIRDYYAAVAAG